MSSASPHALLRWMLLAAAMLAAIAAAAWWTMSPTQSAASERPTRPVPLLPPAAHASQIRTEHASGTSVGANTDPGDPDLTSEAERLEAMARYPAWSQPLDLIGDPLAPHDAPI